MYFLHNALDKYIPSIGRHGMWMNTGSPYADPHARLQIGERWTHVVDDILLPVRVIEHTLERLMAALGLIEPDHNGPRCGRSPNASRTVNIFPSCQHPMVYPFTEVDEWGGRSTALLAA